MFAFDDEELAANNDRLTPTAKRITEGWIAYSLVELKQRYNIAGKISPQKIFLIFIYSLSGPLSPNIDDSLNTYNDLIKSEFSRRWSKHKCNVPGCSTVLIFDGGCKVNIKHRIFVVYHNILLGYSESLWCSKKWNKGIL